MIITHAYIFLSISPGQMKKEGYKGMRQRQRANTKHLQKLGMHVYMSVSSIILVLNYQLWL